MTKRVKNLLVIGIFILCMAVVLVILVLTQPKDDVDDDSVTESSTISVLNYQRDDILTYKITNDNGEFVVRNGVQGFTIDEYNGFRQNSTTLAAAGKCVTSLTAQALVEENASNLDKYGLSEESPKARCDVTLKNGTEYSVYYGINSPDGSTRYFRLADSNDVYTVLLNSSGYFYYREEDFLSLSVTDELTNNNTAPTIDYLTITRKDLDYDVKFEDDSKNYAIDEVSMASAQVMISPVYAYLDITNSNAIIYGLWGLTATSVVKVHPTEADFEKYGLDDPYCTVDLDAELQKYYLRIGDVASYELDQDGTPTTVPAEYYCYYEGIDIIYTFSTSEVPWTTFMPIDILSTMMTSNYIYKLDYIDVNYYGDDAVRYYFDITGDVEETTVEGTVDGEKFNPDDFKILYQFFLQCPIDDLCLEDPTEDDPLIATIDFRRDDGGGDLLEFYDTGANRVTVKLNGTTSFSQPKGYLSVLRQNIEAFKGGASGDDLQVVW